MIPAILSYIAISFASLFMVSVLTPSGRVSSIPVAPLRFLMLVLTLPTVVLLILLFSAVDFLRSLLMEGWESAKSSLRYSAAELYDLPKAVTDCIRGEAWER